METQSIFKRDIQFPIRLSLAVGILLLILKVYVFSITRSTAVLADLFESVVHLFIVGFAVFSFSLSRKPADHDHQYGHDRIAFFSAGFEGAMILIAAIAILYQVSFTHNSPAHLEEGIALFSLTFLINGALGLYLIAQSKRFQSVILEANGRHLLADCITSAGVLLALILVATTGRSFFDPLIASIVALNILWTGARLLKKAVHGLMDRADPEVDQKIRVLLDQESQIHYHYLRHRMTGNRLQIDVHFLFPKDLTLFEAHKIATEIELRIGKAFSQPVDFMSHLEPLDGHDAFHKQILGRNG